MHVASFAGFAPVNSPVIAVAVVLDSPKGAYYGAAVSAPVFAEVAQQVLEYLTVPHDIDLRRPRATKNIQLAEDDTHEQTADINALYAAANDLPSDDPLRMDASQPAATPSAAPGPSPASAQPATAAASGAASTPQPQTAPPPDTATVIVVNAKTLRVPSLLGLPVRKVIEQAAAAGLEVEIAGSGTVREQAPAPGTMVPPGTKIVVRCGR
jgi:cell division protein FtsI (penicillin-binding protein 3)